MGDLARLLHPRSIAVFGSLWAENVIEQCDKVGFQGEIWPVHPKREQVAGRRAFPSVAALPSSPDAAFVGVNRHATLEVLRDLRGAGCGGAICFASGFSETGDMDLQAAFMTAAGDMPALGPNCYGVINALDGAVIWPDQQGCSRVESGVAILSQSSNIAMTLTMQKRGLPIAYLACLGNAAQSGVDRLADAFLSDPRVTALGCYLEGVGDAAAFAAVVSKARAAGKGVVVLKAGRSESGQAAAMTHTASLAGGGIASSAYFRQIGAGEVHSLPELVETLKVLHAHGPLKASRLISVSCSGGEAALAADTAQGTSIEFAPIPEGNAERLRALLGPLVTVSNPLDYHTLIWGDVEKMADVFSEAVDGFDAGLFVIDPPRADICDPASFEPAFEAIAAASARTGRAVLAVSTLSETLDEARAADLFAKGVTPLFGLSEAFAALRAARRPEPVSGWSCWPPSSFAKGDMLNEAEGKALLAAAGIDVPKASVAPDIGSIDLSLLTAPFAVKVLGIAHKSEAGAVHLGVYDLSKVPEMAGAAGVLVEEMVTGAVAEVLIGAARDPVYGATLTLGIGGVAAELLEDTVTLICPVTADQVDAALRRLKLWPLLDGYRGRARADVSAITRVALSVQSMMARDPHFIDIEINPLMVREQGAVAADALIREAKS